MVLSDCASSADDWSGDVAPAGGALSASLGTGAAGRGVCSSAAASWTAGGCAGLRSSEASGGGVEIGGGPNAPIALGPSPYLEAKAAPRKAHPTNKPNKGRRVGRAALRGP